MTRKRPGRPSQTKAPARDSADRLRLWCLCGRLACVRARACRGDPQECANVLRLWLGALAARADAPGLEAAPLLLTKEEARQLALFRGAVEQAEVKPVSIDDEAAADRLRQDLARRILAPRILAPSGESDHAGGGA